MCATTRDLRFIAVHRGGWLTTEEHHQLAQWALNCVWHGMTVLEVHGVEERIADALNTVQQWINGSASVGEIRKVAVVAHAAARASEDEVQKNLARAAGHAVATAHMADHAPGAAAYVLKACKLTGGDTLVEQELAWQQTQLPVGVRERVLAAYPRVLRLVK
jgi:hypothetical protein